MEHLINAELLTVRVAIHLIGVGGNGAQMAACLARLDIAMKALGHPCGLHVTAFDADQVSEANVGRQLYSPADIGQNKAVLTVHRLNQFYGLDWQAEPCRYERHGERTFLNTQPHIVISCVDSAAARAALHQRFFDDHTAPAYWLDLGNTEHSAQVVLGEPGGSKSWTRKQASSKAATNPPPLALCDGTVSRATHARTRRTQHAIVLGASVAGLTRSVRQRRGGTICRATALRVVLQGTAAPARRRHQSGLQAQRPHRRGPKRVGAIWLRVCLHSLLASCPRRSMTVHALLATDQSTEPIQLAGIRWSYSTRPATGF